VTRAAEEGKQDSEKNPKEKNQANE